MGSVFSAAPLESGSCDKPSTSDVCNAINNVVKDEIKVSPNAQSLLGLLSSLGSKWVDLELFLEIGEELGNHGAIDEGWDTLGSAIGELHRESLVEFLGGSDYCRIRVSPGTKFTQVWVYPNEEVYYDVGCKMLFVGMGLMYGLRHLRVQLNACVESAREMAGVDDPRMRDNIRDTLSAGFCALARALGGYGHNRIGAELMMISRGFALGPETNKTRGKSNNAGGEDEDIGLYGARMWIGRDDLERPGSADRQAEKSR
jgi:hypothetical protein